jgi:hypothetical protein
MLKGMFALSLITLQVGALYSCGNSGIYSNKAVFYTKSYYTDDSGAYVPLEVENIIVDLKEDRVIEYPYIGLPTSNTLNGHKYYIDHFYINGDSSKKAISFPYTYVDENVTEYWSELDEYENSVIFIAVWKKSY